MDTSSNNYLRGVIEALLFTSEKPVILEQLKEAIEGVSTGDIREVIVALQSEYSQRKSGIVIVEIAGGYQMLTNSDYAVYLKKFYRTRHKEKLSKPALETLAIIAYKQPVSRMDIELIRGVNSDGVVVNLIEKELIKIVGRKDVPGRPYVYGTTKQFLEYFGLKSLEDLPKLEDFSSLQQLSDAEDAAAQKRETETPTGEGQKESAPQGQEKTEETPNESSGTTEKN